MHCTADLYKQTDLPLKDWVVANAALSEGIHAQLFLWKYLCITKKKYKLFTISIILLMLSAKGKNILKN